MVDEILFAAFHDEMDKVAGAKRVARLYRLRHKSNQHEQAYRRAKEAYERRIGRYGLSEKQRVNPYKQSPKGTGMTYGMGAGTVAGGIAGSLIDPGFAAGLAGGGMVAGTVAGTVADIAVDEGRKYLFRRRTGRAAKNYLKQIGVPRDSIDSVKQPDFPLDKYYVKDDAVPTIASRAVRAGSPKDIPTELLRRGQKTTPAEKLHRRQEVATKPKDKARLQGYLARVRNT